MYYDFVPMPERKPLKWTAGKRLAIIVTFNLEYWDFVKDTEDAYYAGGPAILPDPLPDATTTSSPGLSPPDISLRP